MWFCSHMPKDEADVLNGKKKKPKKGKPASKAAHRPVPMAIAPPPASSNVTTPLPAASSQPIVSQPVPLNAGHAPAMAQQPAITPAQQSAASPHVSPAQAFLPTPLPMPLAPVSAPLAPPVEPSQQLPPVEAEVEDTSSIVTLCPLHNPEWKKIVAARRAAKRLEENRKRVYSLPLGSFVKYRSKNGGVWQAALLQILENESGGEGEIVVSEQTGPMRVPWVRIIWPENEAPSTTPTKRKMESGTSQEATPVPESQSSETDGDGAKRIRMDFPPLPSVHAPSPLNPNPTLQRARPAHHQADPRMLPSQPLQTATGYYPSQSQSHHTHGQYSHPHQSQYQQLQPHQSQHSHPPQAQYMHQPQQNHSHHQPQHSLNQSQQTQYASPPQPQYGQHVQYSASPLPPLGQHLQYSSSSQPQYHQPQYGPQPQYHQPQPTLSQQVQQPQYGQQAHYHHSQHTHAQQAQYDHAPQPQYKEVHDPPSQHYTLGFPQLHHVPVYPPVVPGTPSE